MNITMKQARYGAGGALLAAGSTYTVSDEIGSYMVGQGFAVDTNGALRQKNSTQAAMPDVDPLTGGLKVSTGSGDIALRDRPTLLVVGDSIITNTDLPNQSFGVTITKGSYADTSSVRQRGVMNIYAENPCRFKFRAAHLLNTGDYVWVSNMPSGHPLAHKPYTVTVLAADEVTLDGIDATAMAPFTSGVAASDAFATVDHGNGSAGILTWLNFFMGQPWSSMRYRPVPGRTSAQIAAAIKTDIGGGSYSHSILHAGRNDSVFDKVSLDAIRDALLACSETVVVSLPYPDGNWATPANDADALKIAAIGNYWNDQQAANPRIKVVDLYGVFSDPSKVLMGSRSSFLAGDSVHPSASGGIVGGSAFSGIIMPKTQQATVQKSRATSDNALLNGRLGGIAGAVGSGAVGTVATNWTVGNRSTNVAGSYAYTVKTPSRQRLNAAVVTQGDTVSITSIPGYLWLCKTAGTTAAAEPVGFASGVLWDFATGVTDGTAVFVKIPDITNGSKQNTSWQLIEYAASTGTNENLSFYQEVALPTAIGLAVGDYARAECDLIVFGQMGYTTLQLTCMDSGSVQLARAHDLSANSIVVDWVYESIAGRCKTPVIRIPTGCTKVEARIKMGFSSAYKVRAFISNMVIGK